jgi:hypothetical protein
MRRDLPQVSASRTLAEAAVKSRGSRLGPVTLGGTLLRRAIGVNFSGGARAVPASS